MTLARIPRLRQHLLDGVVAAAIVCIGEGLDLDRHGPASRGRRRRRGSRRRRRRRRDWLRCSGRGRGAALRHHHPAPAADGDTGLRRLDGDLVRPSVAVFVGGLDAEQIVGRQLPADAGQRGFGVADLDVEQGATGGAGELLEPAREQGAVAVPVVQALVALARLRREAIDEAGVDEERVDRGVGERRFLADADAEIGQVWAPAGRVAGDHAAADQHHGLAPNEPPHLLHHGAKHVEARGRFTFQEESGAGDVGEQPVLAEGIGRVAALAGGDGVDPGSAAAIDLAGHVDELGRADVELRDLGEVPLADDLLQRGQHGGMILRWIHLRAVRIRRQADVVVRRQLLHELARRLDHAPGRVGVEADAVDREHDDAAARERGRAVRDRAAPGVAADAFRGDDPAAPAVDGDVELLRPEVGHGIAFAVDHLNVDGDDVDGYPERLRRGRWGLGRSRGYDSQQRRGEDRKPSAHVYCARTATTLSQRFAAPGPLDVTLARRDRDEFRKHLTGAGARMYITIGIWNSVVISDVDAAGRDVCRPRRPDAPRHPGPAGGG